MNLQDIPPQVLSEVYKSIARQHDTEPGKLKKNEIKEEEFMAALAYNQGAPLLEDCDLTETLVSLCRQCSRELEISSLAEYRFVPMTVKGQTLVVISSSPWDPMLTEVIGGYFSQCSQVKFALTSPQTLTALLEKLKADKSAAVAPVAGYAPKAAPAPVPRPVVPMPPTQAPTAPPRPAPVAPRVTGPTPVVHPAPAVPPAPAPRMQSSRPQAPAAAPAPAPATTVQDLNYLSTDEVTYLWNLWLSEANKLLQRKRNSKP